jgi:type I restriction enzyme S subunit
MSEWKTYRLWELGRIVTGKTPPTADKENFGDRYPFITPVDMNGQKNIFKTSRYLSEKARVLLKNNVLPPNTICISCIGSDLGKVVKTTTESFTNQQINSIVCNDTFDSDFVYYALKILSPELKNIGHQSTAVPIINKSDFSEFEVFAPTDKTTQTRIASILSSLDDKIELNRQTNQTLETIAQTLFQEMCVPKGDELPEGWREGTLGEIVEITSSKRIFLSDYVQEGVPFYRGKEIIELHKGKVISTELFITLDKFAEIKKKFGAPKFRDILITSVGTIGVPYLIMEREPNFYFKDGNLTWIKSFYTDVSSVFIYQWLISKVGQDSIKKITIGSTQQAITIESLKKLEVIIPTSEIVKSISNTLEKLRISIQSSIEETQTLTVLRDSLLPKLMKGEIEVK